MNPNYYILYIAVLLLLGSCQQQQASFVSERNVQQTTQDSLKQKRQDEIAKEYYTQAAQYHYNSKEWHLLIDKGIEQDSTIALFWKLKALPYWKNRKYQMAVKYFEKAVKYDREKYLSRSGFLKTVFVKDYHAALKDLIAYENEFGNTYENDHSIPFYKTLCYLSLNQPEKALAALLPEIQENTRKRGEDWVHFVDYFYLGICYYDLNEYEKAIDCFDKSLKQYDSFSDAQYWKAHACFYLGRNEEGFELLRQGNMNYQNGYTFNEDSSIYYELYPYQVSWEWQYIEEYWKNRIEKRLKNYLDF